MKLKYYFAIASSAILCLTGCGGKGSHSPSSSESPYIRDENYNWSIEGKDYLRDEFLLLASSKYLTPDPMYVKIGNETYNEYGGQSIQATFNYTGIQINSDNSNNAADYIYLNGEKLQKLASDGSKGVSIDENLLKQGENTVMVTIGQYWSTKEYDENKNHGNQSCDDYRISDFRITTPTKNTVYPTKIRRYYAKKVGLPAKGDNLVVTEEDYNPEEIMWIGDGWGEYYTWYGHTDPRYNIPFKVEFIFDYQKETYYQFKVDTKLLKDGQYNISLYENQRKVIQQPITVDNTNPTIEANIIDNSIVNVDVEKLEVKFDDRLSGIQETYIKLDGAVFLADGTFPEHLSEGKHTILIYAMDKAGNKFYKTIEFYASQVGMFKNFQSTKVDNGVSFTSETNFAMTAYQATPINVTLKQGVLNDQQSEALKLPATTSLKKGMPYHSMTFNVDNSVSKILVNYEGGTSSYERFAIKAKNNQTQEFDTLITGIGMESLQFELEIENYKANDTVELYIVNDFVSNNSDTMIWVTDTQHYTKFDDLNEVLYKMMEYSANQYRLGKAGYFIHTGDLVDDNIVGTADVNLVVKEWNIADAAHKIIEDAGMPNGVVTGNHDTSTSLETLTYGHFGQYFGQDRFNKSAWFGGSLNNNASHYDLITIADKDFMIVYLGYGVEGDEDTIAWANSVISRYPNRNVILATHDYLMYNGGNGITSTTSRYNEIFNGIIVPNNNVIMVLCGHDNGAFHRQVDVPGSDRKVYEILSDYQFVDSNPSKHIIGSVQGCSGDGYLRRMTFSDTAMITTTYSPYFIKYNPFGTADNFAISMNYVENNRLISSQVMEVYALNNATNYDAATSQLLQTSGNGKYVVRLVDANNNYAYQII